MVTLLDGVKLYTFMWSVTEIVAVIRENPIIEPWSDLYATQTKILALDAAGATEAILNFHPGLLKSNRISTISNLVVVKKLIYHISHYASELINLVHSGQISRDVVDNIWANVIIIHRERLAVAEIMTKTTRESVVC